MTDREPHCPDCGQETHEFGKLCDRCDDCPCPPCRSDLVGIVPCLRTSPASPKQEGV